MISNHILRINYGNNSISKEEFYPCLAYIDSDGKIKDMMFSSIIFDFSAVPQSLTVWETALDSFFAEGQGIGALDSAFGDIKTLLSVSDKKCEVYFRFPHTCVSLSPFGDMNRDGITEKILDTEDRVTAVNWFVTSAERRLKALNLPHTAVKGWICENDCDDDFANGCEALFGEKCFSAVQLDNDRTVSVSEIDSVTECEDWQIFYCENYRALLNSAVSADVTVRKPYECLYGIIRSQCAGVYGAKDPAEETLKEERSSGYVASEEITPQETEAFSECPDDESVTEPQDKPQEKTAKPRGKKRRRIDADKDKKRILVGAALTAAALGVIYLIKKSSEE